MKNSHLLILILFIGIIIYLFLNKKESFEYCLDNKNINFISKRDEICNIYETKLNNNITKVKSENKNVSYCIDNNYNIYSREQCYPDEMEVFMN